MIEAHDAALAFGGRPGIHDLSLVQSAIGRPYSGYHRRIYRKAAALAQSLAQNHGFVDGNKRTAFYMVDLLLANSGYTLNDPDEDPDVSLEHFIVRIVKERLPIAEIADWFKDRIVKR